MQPPAMGPPPAAGHADSRIDFSDIATRCEIAEAALGYPSRDSFSMEAGEPGRHGRPEPMRMNGATFEAKPA